jgi:hypothetical protein
MKKLLAFLLLLLNFLVLPSAVAKDEVVLDRITQSEAEDLDIEIPDNVPPGHHTITIEVYDDNGTVSKKQIPFCKDNEGVVQWDDKCPDLDVAAPVATEDPIQVKSIELGLKPYDPLKDKETTHGLQLAAFAALAALTSIKRNDKKGEEYITCYTGTFILPNLGSISFANYQYELPNDKYIDPILFATGNFIESKGFKYTIYNPDCITHLVYLGTN